MRPPGAPGQEGWHSRAVPLVDLADETFVVVPPARLAPRLGFGTAVPWWPDLVLTVTRDRGEKGTQWAVDGALAGTAEIWLEPVRDGTVVHCYLRGEPPSGVRRSGRAADRLRRARTLAWKRWVHALKDELEAGRPAGVGLEATAPRGGEER